LVRVIYSLFEHKMLSRIFVTSKVMLLPFLIKQTPETLTTFRKLAELDLIVLSFIQNYDLLKYYAINLKNIVRNVSGSNRQTIKNIRFRFSLSSQK